VPASRRLSHHISEGDGIAILVHVPDVAAAREAEQQGAKGLVVDVAIDGIREATTLPLLWRGRGVPGDADARAIRAGEHDGHDGADLELVVDVRDEDELERALEELDPEIFLLSSREADEDDDPVESVLSLLPDVPAGKLAIAEVAVESRDEVLQLERAGFDAVLVPGGSVSELVGTRPPDV
jgi:Indole-3-glycerol phosphate synthase